MEWSIRDLAREYDVTLRTIRHYEALGLLDPERRGQTRVFHNRDRIRLELVLRGRRLGFSLDEIARIVNMYDDRPGEDGQLRYLLDQIAVRRAELARMREDIARTEADLDAVEARCQETLAQLPGRAPGTAPERPLRGTTCQERQAARYAVQALFMRVD
jgi:DNA-binding transcriptional MerR regulator